MKHYFILIFSTFLISTSVLAQSPPQSFTYQTVIRDNAYNIMANQDVTLRISIIEDSPNGTIVYQEKVPVTTSPIGLVNLNIGEGNNPSGDFDSIDWANHIFFLEIAADFDSNNNFVIFGTTQLRSVPYALYALNAGNANQGLQGPPGQDGVDGEQGPQGPIGETGPQGEQGIQGPTGETGPQGEQGIPGINGLNGDDGIGIINTIDNQDGTFTLVYSDGSLFTTSNFTGQQGIQGPIGETGPQGEQGIQGEVGPQGEQGLQGPVGETGLQGEQGIPGINGLNGEDGIGIINTIDNQDGTFTLVYSDGSLFTTSNFTGQQGIQGPIGETGPQGEQGIQGEQGLQGPIGETGLQGEQGIPGINGLNGEDGIGIINTIDNQDGSFTLVFSDGSLFTTPDFTGQQGIQGPIGETGPQGEQGIQGPIGNTIWQQDDLNNILYNSGNVNIGANNTNSAILNISSTTQGILIPSLNENERDNIFNPATGLLIFQNDVEPGFYFYDGTNWKSINSNSSSSFDPSIIYTIDGF